MIVRADAEPQPGAPDRGEVGGFQILLAEVDERAAAPDVTLEILAGSPSASGRSARRSRCPQARG